MAEWNLQYEIEEMFGEEVLEKVDLINIGGGIPSEYANTNTEVVEGVLEKIKNLRRWLNERNIQLMVEPGRYIAASSGKLATKIISVYENNLVVDASVYNSDMDALIVPVKLLVEGELGKNDEGAKPYVIKGITPCSMDLFRYRVYLKNPKEGDEIVFLNAGAYNFATDFCDLKKINMEIK